jgi:hypothetical protein
MKVSMRTGPSLRYSDSTGITGRYEAARLNVSCKRIWFTKAG